MPASSGRPRTRRSTKRLRASGGLSRASLRARRTRRPVARRGRLTARAKEARSKLQAERQRLDAEHQAAVKNFETAAKYFSQQNYAKAKELFEKLAASPYAELADRARVHLRACDQRLKSEAPAPKSVEELFNLGVAEINRRNLEAAKQLLSKADKIEPNREEIRYALAAVYALEGNPDAALEHLKASIELRPANRYQARQDDDFESLRSDARFRALTARGSSSPAS